MLTRIADDVWVDARPLRFFGVETGTRMTIVRLTGGGLFVHSPVALDAETRAQVDALGAVEAIVAPSLFHHLYVADWARAYPRATLSACPGLERKRKDVAWTRVLGDSAEPEWRGDLEQVLFGAAQLTNEVLFFHTRSGTLISSDFIFNLGSHPSRVTRIAARLMGQREPGTTLLERLMIRDRSAARAQIDRVLAWPAERVVLAHGDILDTGGCEVVRRAYAWL